jgi:hypothetical protein
MTTALGPPRNHELEGRAHEAERRLLLTLDVLAERRRNLRATLHRARAKLESGAVILSIFLASVAVLGILSLTRRTHGVRSRWRR